MASYKVKNSQNEKRNAAYIISLALLIFSGIVIISKSGAWAILGWVDIGVVILTGVFHWWVTHKVVPRA